MGVPRTAQLAWADAAYARARWGQHLKRCHACYVAAVAHRYDRLCPHGTHLRTQVLALRSYARKVSTGG